MERGRPWRENKACVLRNTHTSCLSGVNATYRASERLSNLPAEKMEVTIKAFVRSGNTEIPIFFMAMT